MKPNATTASLGKYLHVKFRQNRGTLAERFWKRVLPTHTRVYDACWTWQGFIDPKSGYGKIGFRNMNLLAHRVSYELLIGPVPNGLQLDHTCRHRPCVNPMHLEPVTQSENLRRGDMFHRRKTHCINGYPYSGENLVIVNRGNSKEERRCRICIAATRQRQRDRFHPKAIDNWTQKHTVRPR